MALKIQTRGNLFIPFNDEEEKLWKDPFWFIQAADTQFGMIDAARHEDYGWEEEIKLTENAIHIANTLVPLPKFFVVCGDMVHAYPGEKNKEKQIDAFKQAFTKLNPNIPLVCVCGNHDIGNIPTRSAILSYRKAFGDDYFSYWAGGIKFIVLNSQYFYNCSQVSDFKKEQDIWLLKELEDGKIKTAKHIIIFQHIPWFLRNPQEENDYYEYEGKEGLFNIDKDIRLPMMNLFKKYNVSKIFCGHYHRNAVGWDQEIEVVTTSAVGCQLGTSKSGMRIVKVYPDQVFHKYYEFESFPKDQSEDPYLNL